MSNRRTSRSSTGYVRVCVRACVCIIVHTLLQQFCTMRNVFQLAIHRQVSCKVVSIVRVNV
jgi:hypothetical protein